MEDLVCSKACASTKTQKQTRRTRSYNGEDTQLASSSIGDNLSWISSFLSNFWHALSTSQRSGLNANVPKHRMHRLQGDVGLVNLYTSSEAVVVSHQLDRTLVFAKEDVLSDAVLAQMQDSLVSLAVEAAALISSSEKSNRRQCAHIDRISQQSPHGRTDVSDAFEPLNNPCVSSPMDADTRCTSTDASKRKRLSKNRYYVHGINPTLLADNSIHMRLNIIEISAKYGATEACDSLSSKHTRRRGLHSGRARFTQSSSAHRLSSSPWARKKRAAAPRFLEQYTAHTRCVLLTEIRGRRHQ
jgi:hypothetical protein